MRRWIRQRFSSFVAGEGNGAFLIYGEDNYGYATNTKERIAALERSASSAFLCGLWVAL